MTTQKNRKRTWKLSKQAKIYICQRVAAFKHYQEICNELVELYGVRVQRQAIADLLHSRRKKTTRWMDMMLRFREEYLEAVQDVPIANKRKRLEYLQKAYNRAIEWHETPSAYGPIEKCLPAAAVKAVEAARQEVEGLRINVTGSVDHRLQGWDDLSPEEQWKRFASVMNDVKQGKVSTN